MPVQRKYNVWKTGIILKIRNFPGHKYPWGVVAISKVWKEKYNIELDLKYFDQFATWEEARDSIPEIQKTIKKHKFPR